MQKYYHAARPPRQDQQSGETGSAVKTGADLGSEQQSEPNIGCSSGHENAAMRVLEGRTRRSLSLPSSPSLSWTGLTGATFRRSRNEAQMPEPAVSVGNEAQNSTEARPFTPLQCFAGCESASVDSDELTGKDNPSSRDAEHFPPMQCSGGPRLASPQLNRVEDVGITNTPYQPSIFEKHDTSSLPMRNKVYSNGKQIQYPSGAVTTCSPSAPQMSNSVTEWQDTLFRQSEWFERSVQQHEVEEEENFHYKIDPDTLHHPLTRAHIQRLYDVGRGQDQSFKRPTSSTPASTPRHPDSFAERARKFVSPVNSVVRSGGLLRNTFERLMSKFMVVEDIGECGYSHESEDELMDIDGNTASDSDLASSNKFSHIRSDESDLFHCARCTRAFKTNISLIEHLQAAHKIPCRPYVCSACYCAFSTHSGFDRHWNAVHEDDFVDRDDDGMTDEEAADAEERMLRLEVLRREHGSVRYDPMNEVRRNGASGAEIRRVGPSKGDC